MRSTFVAHSRNSSIQGAGTFRSTLAFSRATIYKLYPLDAPRHPFPIPQSENSLAARAVDTVALCLAVNRVVDKVAFDRAAETPKDWRRSTHSAECFFAQSESPLARLSIFIKRTNALLRETRCVALFQFSRFARCRSLRNSECGGV